MKRLTKTMEGEVLPARHTTISSKTTIAELSLQRGEHGKAHQMLKDRIAQGANDFKTYNLYGVSLARLDRFDEAIAIFTKLRGKRHPDKGRAIFNLGLVLFYRDLSIMGDLSVAHYTKPRSGVQFVKPAPAKPFDEAIFVWEELLHSQKNYHDLLYAHLSFAYLQAGEMDRSLDRLIHALSHHESFFITHYVLGRIFIDLFHLANLDSNYALHEAVLEFFEIQDYEIMATQDDRSNVRPETFLDIALQAFNEARQLNPISPEALAWVCQCYLILGMVEEAEEALGALETFASDHLITQETALRFHQLIQSGHDTVLGIVQRIDAMLRKRPEQRFKNILPANYLT